MKWCFRLDRTQHWVLLIIQCYECHHSWPCWGRFFNLIAPFNHVCQYFLSILRTGHFSFYNLKVPAFINLPRNGIPGYNNPMVNQKNQFMNVICFRSFHAFHFDPIHLIEPNTKHDSSNLRKILLKAKRVVASLCGKLPTQKEVKPKLNKLLNFLICTLVK